MIPILFEKIKEKYGYKRVNKPTAKAQSSMTKRDRRVIGLDVEEFAEIFRTEMELARTIIEKEIIKTLTNKRRAQQVCYRCTRWLSHTRSR